MTPGTEGRSFEAVIEGAGRGGAFIRLPFDPKEVFGSGRAKVVVRFDGHPYRGSVANMGQGPMVPVRKDVRAAIGKEVGDRVRVEVEEDTAPRVVQVPAELQAALKGAPEARVRYDALSYTHRREFAQWVADAKKQDTRDRRAARAVAMILEGRTR